jgi:hypothetical protein
LVWSTLTRIWSIGRQAKVSVVNASISAVPIALSDEIGYADQVGDARGDADVDQLRQCHCPVVLDAVEQGEIVALQRPERRHWHTVSFAEPTKWVSRASR